MKVMWVAEMEAAIVELEVEVNVAIEAAAVVEVVLTARVTMAVVWIEGMMAWTEAPREGGEANGASAHRRKPGDGVVLRLGTNGAPQAAAATATVSRSWLRLRSVRDAESSWLCALAFRPVRSLRLRCASLWPVISLGQWSAPPGNGLG